MQNSPNATELLRRGQAAARVGRREEARDYLRRAVELDPERVQAWLDLAGVEEDPDKKRLCFETVLSLDPQNEEAALGLEMLGYDAVRAPFQTTAEDELETVIAEASRRLERAVGPPPPDEVPLDDGVFYCANHPNVETVLRCNRCGKPICTRCAVQTPVGYRCRECVGQQQSIFYSGGTLGYVIGGALALVLSAVASYLMILIGAWFFALILGPAAGIGVAEAVRFAVRRRRSRRLWAVVAVAMVIGALPALLPALVSLWRLITLGLFLVLAVSAASARLR
ncbi:MAG: tetratricopeptide repeat protein [Anaerolineae bacterium]|nr:tetratricopeptide repeat protein [Anaerolineae bacterium]